MYNIFNPKSIASVQKKKKKNTLNLLLSHVWWRIARFSGATIALFCLPNASREKAFKVSALMGANLLLFSFGYGISTYGLSFYSLPCYNLLEPNRSPLQIILGVVKLAIHNRHCNCPCTKKKGFIGKTIHQVSLRRTMVKYICRQKFYFSGKVSHTLTLFSKSNLIWV